MHHDWIFDVLKDLHAYACQNDLPRLADAAEVALSVARAETAEQAGFDARPGMGKPGPPN
jgi:hypothetical protein